MLNRRHRHLNAARAGATLVLDARYIAGLADGDMVATWSDRSGNGNNATQSTDAEKPIYKVGIQGGGAVVRFDGSNDSLIYGTSLFTYTGGRTVFSVFKTAGGAGEYGGVVSEFSATRTSISCQVTIFPNAGPELGTDVYNAGGVRFNSTFSGSVFHIGTWSWSNWSTHKTNGSTVLGVDGVTNGGTAWGSDPSSFTSTNKRIGRFDSGTGVANFTSMDLGALVVFGAEIAAPLRRRVQTALAFSWKIPCS